MAKHSPAKERPRAIPVDKMSEDQRAGFRRTISGLRAIRASDRPHKLTFDALSARALLLEGDRGSGKTSLLLSLTGHLQAGKVPGVTVVCDPIEVRSLDRSDRVLSTMVQKLKLFARRENAEKVAEQSAKWRRLESALVRSHDVYTRFIAASAASEEELVELLKLREGGTDETRALIREFVEDLTVGHPNRGESPPRLLVFPLDDLDALGLRAWEAITDIDRYLSVPGLAFVFTGRDDALRLAIRRGLQREAGDGEWAEDDKRTIRSEANNLLAKYFPLAERAHLHEWEPTARLRFSLPRGPSIERTLAALLLPELADLFTSRSPVPFPHAERLPAQPRPLRSLTRALAETEDQDPLVSSVLTVQALLDEAGVKSGWANWWRGVCAWVRGGGAGREGWVGDRRDEKRRLAEELLGALRQPYAREWAQRAIGQAADYQRRYPGGLLAPVFVPTRETGADAPEMDDAGWLEFFLDFAMALAPELTVDVTTILGWDQIISQRTFVQVPQALQSELHSRQRLVRWFVPADRYPDIARRERLQLGGGNLHLLALADLRRNPADMAIFPMTVRGLLAYIRFHDIRSRDPQMSFSQASTAPNDAKDLDDLEERLDQLIESHVRACLFAAGSEMQPSDDGLDSFIDDKGRLKLFSDAFSPRLLQSAFASVQHLADRKSASTAAKWRKAEKWFLSSTSQSR